jgi:hypothetical protein
LKGSVGAVNKTEKIYHSFLLRLWQAGAKDEYLWRITLESPQTGERWSFVSLEALLAFLKDLLKK